MPTSGAIAAALSDVERRPYCWPLYEGRPWFLPIVGEWYRLRDRIDRQCG